MEITYFDRKERVAVIETDGGKVKISFADWKRLVEAYTKWHIGDKN